MIRNHRHHHIRRLFQTRIQTRMMTLLNMKKQMNLTTNERVKNRHPPAMKQTNRHRDEHHQLVTFENRRMCQS